MRGRGGFCGRSHRAGSEMMNCGHWPKKASAVGADRRLVTAWPFFLFLARIKSAQGDSLKGE